MNVGISIKDYRCEKYLASLPSAWLWSSTQHKYSYSHLLYRVSVLLTLSCLNVTATKRAHKFLADMPDRAISKNRKASITYYPEFISSPFKRGNNTRQIVGSFIFIIFFLSARKICPVPQSKNKLL